MIAQHHLDLFGSSDSTLDRDALIETRGRWRYIYGRWDRLFGAWRGFDAQPTLPFVPQFPLLRADGEPVDALAPESELPDDNDGIYFATDPDEFWQAAFDRCLTEDRRLLQEYTTLITPEARLATGALKRPANQWLALCAIWADHGLSDMLRRETASVGSGYVEFCFALSSLDAGSPARAARFLRDCLTVRRTDFVANLIGKRVRPATIRLLSRLSDVENLSAPVVHALLELNETPERLALLAGARDLLCRVVRLEEWLIPAFRHARFLTRQHAPEATEYTDPSEARQDENEFHSMVADAESAYAYLRAESRSLPTDWQSRLQARIAGARSPAGLCATLARAIDEFVGFPAPPWAGNLEFRPIGTMRQLKREALRFRNCAIERRSEILRRRCAIYVADDPCHTMIEVRRDTDQGAWRIGDAQILPREGDTASATIEIRHRFVSVFRDFWGGSLRT